MDALLDANVLYSITLTDALLCIAEDSLFLPLWSEQILREAEQALITRGRNDVYAVRQRFLAMREAFPTAMIDVEDYGHLVAQMHNHEKDRHVLAAAAAARVAVVVTGNVKHFPRRALAGLPVGGIMTPDAFLCALHRSEPLLVESALNRAVSGKRRPPMTLRDLAACLARSGAPGFAALLTVVSAPDPANP